MQPKLTIKDEPTIEAVESSPINLEIKQEPQLPTSNIEIENSFQLIHIDSHGNSFVDLGRNRRASLTSYRGKQMIHIRQFFMDKQKEMVPGKKGIALSQVEWNKLLAIREQLHFHDIPNQIKEEKEVNELPKKEIDAEGNPFFCIGRNRRVSFSFYKGKRMLHIREYYEDENNEMRPSKRGIALVESEWIKLMLGKDIFKFN